MDTKILDPIKVLVISITLVLLADISFTAFAQKRKTVVGKNQMKAQKPKVPAGASNAQAAASVDSPSKFLLQIGIDKYKYVTPLSGCVQDVKDLRQVLDERFGFSKPAENTLQLLNEKATYVAILKAFRTQLIENAKKYPNAIVVFQFSGHGSRVKDTNGDEADGWDETLVPYDSRDLNGGAFDITDDELNDLFAELSKYTSNITFILDSCFSGTGTRGGVARIIEEDKRPQPKQKTFARGDGNSQDIPNTDILRAGNGYVTISGALNNELAHECNRRIGGKEKQNGVLTLNLVEALKKAGPETTYRQIMAQVAPAVTLEYPDQHPQVEGDIRRKLFGSIASSEEPFIRIRSIKGKQIVIEAGQPQGVREGSLLAIYAPDARQLKGEVKKLANAMVTKVTSLTSEAEMPDESKAVTVEGKAILVSPNFGTEPMKVLTPTSSPIKHSSSQTERSLPDDFLSALEKRKLIEVISGSPQQLRGVESVSDNYHVAIRRGQYGKVFEKLNAITGKPEGAPANTDDIYYLDKGDGGPEFGFYARTDDAGEGIKIAEALENMVIQRGLISLSNNATPASLTDKIKLTVLIGEQLLERSDGSGYDIKDGTMVTSKAADYIFDQGTYFQIKIENTSDLNLYITLFDISTNGKVEIMYPPQGATDPMVKGRSVTVRTYRTTGPPGIEVFKVMATTSPSDFSTLVRPGVDRKRRGVISPIDWLMELATGKTRADPVMNVSKVDSWTTAETRFWVSDRLKK